MIRDQVHVLVRKRPVEWPAEVAHSFKGPSSRVRPAEFGWLARWRVRQYIQLQRDSVA
jgi:hypothetical protein